MISSLDPTIQSLIEDWEGEEVVSRFDEPTETWIFIALHSSVRGMPTGGTRMRRYSSPADGLRDAMNLAGGMTAKWAVLGADKGGGKAVLALSRELQGGEKEGLLRRFGALVDSLQGGFATGEDLGTTPEDMAIIRQETRYVHGLDPDGTMTDPGPLTAAGVAHGIDAALNRRFQDHIPNPVTVLVQGVGDVGAPLCAELSRREFRLLVSDLDAARAEEVAHGFDAEVVAPSRALESECDVLAPCAIGGILNQASIPRLRCRIVAGSANNQLAEADDARRLAERDILYVPDYVINAGGALAFGLHSEGLTDHDELLQRMPAIGELVAEILDAAEKRKESPLAAARRRVDRALRRT